MRSRRRGACGCLVVFSTAVIVAAPGATADEPVAKVLRIPTRDGTLILEVGDPEVKVSVDREKDEVTITGAVAHEIRLRPGEYPIKTVKDDKSLTSDLIAISRAANKSCGSASNPPERSMRSWWVRISQGSRRRSSMPMASSPGSRSFLLMARPWRRAATLPPEVLGPA